MDVEDVEGEIFDVDADKLDNLDESAEPNVLFLFRLLEVVDTLDSVFFKDLSSALL
jgi:hypothetical protein